MDPDRTESDATGEDGPESADDSDAPSGAGAGAESESKSNADSEPGTWNPETEFRDPDNDSLTIPKVDTEDAGSTFWDDFNAEHEHEHEFESVTVPEVSTAESDVPSELLKAFWGLVLVINAAVLAVALGLLFLIFEGVSPHGVALVVGGLVLFGFAYRRYRSYQARSDEFTVDESVDDEPADETANTDAGKSTSGTGAEQRIPDDSDRS